jgi:hypothetical protein
MQTAMVGFSMLLETFSHADNHTGFKLVQVAQHTNAPYVVVAFQP